MTSANRQARQTPDVPRSLVRFPLILVAPEVEAGTFAVGKVFGHVEEGYRTAYRELAKWRSGMQDGKREKGKGKTKPR